MSETKPFQTDLMNTGAFSPTAAKKGGLLLRFIRAAQPISRTEIVTRLGIDKSTVTDNVKPLISSGILREDTAGAEGPGYDQESTPGLVASGATVVVFTTGNGTTIGNAIAPVIKLASNNRVFEKMSQDLDVSAGNVIEGTESIAVIKTHGQ